ncbi:6-pyruvoyl trahydropterin synthase family protein [Parvibium lacunae]|uniref:6-carboxy-5,6,7,8-tetrahydropterin synthase n=1 Tax=Parvibium lacunae TaxID=1888893 RepID=A0A368L6F5_9BURK|nr:6-carboxytetrahydropterin synthase [Parvibium lacunae]RCS59206.1 6-carboxytetrahydropterin synthase [Parvibium lacunae]
MHELTQSFIFEAAHTLNRAYLADPAAVLGSKRIHGHSYRALVTVRGIADPTTGMLLDLHTFRQQLHTVQSQLDHHLLDEVADLGPATLENLTQYIWRQLQPTLASLYRVTVERVLTGDSCSYYGT